MIIDKIIGKSRLTKKIISRVCAVILIFFIFWAYGLHSYVKNIPKIDQNKEYNADAIIILTGGSQRIEHGLDLLVKKSAGKMFISGVGEDVTLANLLLNSAYVPASIGKLVKDIELGYEAKNTKGNADEVYDWVKKNNYRRIILVTANYHMPRSVVEFERKLHDIDIVPYPIEPDRFNLEGWFKSPIMRKVLIREYNKYLVTKIGL